MEVAKPRVTPLPPDPDVQVQQAAAAVEAAWRDGVTLQRVELLLPLIGATDLDDWPGGIRQQFQAAQPLVEKLLRALKQKEGLQGPLSAEIWDQGDAVGAWRSPALACVLFPTASTLDRLRKVTESKPALTIIVNPQWGITSGNLMSEFGFGQRKKNAEEYISKFEPTYFQKQLRIYGDSVRLLRAYPGEWQVHVLRRNGSNECIHMQASQPSYKDVEALLRQRPDSMVNKPLAERLKEEWQFNQDSLNDNVTR